MEVENVERKKEMEEFIRNFQDMPDRLLKYCEILLEGGEASPFSYQDTMSYRRLAIELTTYCNLNCIWCYRHDPNFKHVLNKEIPIQKIKAMVANTKGKFRMVHFGGVGEPLLYSHLYEAIEEVKKLSSHIKITTNGTLLTKEKIDDMTRKGLTHIEISVDAFNEEENLELRGSKLVTLIKNIKYISDENKLHLQINSVVSNLNHNSLKNAVEVLKECNNINFLHLIPLFMTKQMKEKGIDRISDEKFIDILKKLDNDIKKYNLKWELHPSPYGVRLDPVIEMKRRRNICFDCFEDPYISIEGELLPCGRQKIYGGADATVGFEKAWNHPKLLKFRKNMLTGNYPALCGKLCYLKERTEEIK